MLKMLALGISHGIGVGSSLALFLLSIMFASYYTDPSGVAIIFMLLGISFIAFIFSMDWSLFYTEKNRERILWIKQSSLSLLLIITLYGALHLNGKNQVQNVLFLSSIVLYVIIGLFYVFQKKVEIIALIIMLLISLSSIDYSFFTKSRTMNIVLIVLFGILPLYIYLLFKGKNKRDTSILRMLILINCNLIIIITMLNKVLFISVK